MKQKEYNGWYNYNVWNVMLYVANERDIYDLEQFVFKERYEGRLNTKQFTKKLNQIGNAAHKVSDIKNKKLTQKEIVKIRKGLRREYKEWRDENVI